MTKNAEPNDPFLKEALRIGDWLLARAETDDLGMHWKTMSMDIDRNTTFIQSENIYTGVSGIVLFFLELYKQSRAPRFMDAARQGMIWVVNYCRKNPPVSYAFFTGRMGVSYTLLQMHRFFGDAEYLENAITLAKPCRASSEEANRIDDLINGSSGTILGLLHLHAATAEKWILEAIDHFISALLKQTYQGPKGLYWDRSPYNIGGLCGFSHGAAGIGYVFLELGHYFQNDAFFKTAEQAFLYERLRYKQNEKQKNWPDLRKGIYTDEDFQKHRDAFLAGDLEFFTRGSEMNAWCHGAAGIGLSRLRAYQLLKNPLYLDEARLALEKTALTDVAPPSTERLHILCHGSAGNAEVFLYAYQILNNKQYLENAEKIAANILDAYPKYNRYLPGFHGNNTGEDTSLFMGNAGIGYFLLRLRDPLNVPSILAPSLDAVSADATPAQTAANYPAISISPADMIKRLLEKYFPRTILVCEEIIPAPLTAFHKNIPLDSSDNEFSLNDSFVAFVETHLPNLPAAKKEILADAFELETEKRLMDKEIISDSLLTIKYRVRNLEAEKIIEKGQDALLTRELVLDPACHLTYTLWNWYMSSRENWRTNLHKEKEEEICPFLLKPTSLGISEYELSPFSYTILAEFIEVNRVDRALQATLDAFETLAPEEEAELKGQIIQQIEQALLAGVLTENTV